MTSIAERKVKNYRSFMLVGFALGLWFLLFALLPIWHPKVHIDKCLVDLAGSVMPDRSADGVLTEAAGIDFVRRDGVDDSSIGTCAGK